jgi:protein-disulfide isomerase
MKSFRFLLAAATALISIPAIAQEKNPFADRENRVAPIISYFQSKGVKLTSIGDAGGLLGYLGEDATGKQQVFYVTPDGKHVVAGLMIGLGGTIVTGIQVGEMRARFEAAAKSFDAEAQQQQSLLPNESVDKAASEKSDNSDAEKSDAPVAPSVLPSSSSDTSPTASDDVKPKDDEKLSDVPSDEHAVLLPPAEGPASGSLGNMSELWISKLDKDDFLKKAEALPYFEVGSVTSPSTLWMVADPQCPFCHKAWDHIKQSVLDKKIKVRVIMIAGLKGSEPIATDMLAHVRPARAWLDTNAGRNLKLSVDPASPEYAKAHQYLEKNMDFARSMGFDATPFLGYVAKDGKFYSSLGLPNDLKSFFAETGI